MSLVKIVQSRSSKSG